MTGIIALEDSTYSVREQDGSVDIAIVRTGDLSGPATVEYATNPDTALAGSDFTTISGSVTFAPGQARAVITVPILNDIEVEATETFNFSIVNVVDASLLFPRTALIDILDDENPVTPPVEPALIANYAATQQAVITTGSSTN